MLKKNEVNPGDLDWLLRFPVQANQQSPVDFIGDMGWGAVKSLSAMDEYRNLDRDIENNQKRWRKFVEADAPEKEKFPQVCFGHLFFSFYTTPINEKNIYGPCSRSIHLFT